MRPAAATLLGLLLTADCVPAGTAQEHYQAALMQEKGEGALEKAIRLYEQVIRSHEEGEEGTDSLAARAKLRIGLCQEKLGLARARETYEAVIEDYPEEAQARMEAARNLRSASRRQDSLEAGDRGSPDDQRAARRRRPRPRGPARASLTVVVDSLALHEQLQELKDLLEQAAASSRLRHDQARALRRAIEALLQRNEHGQWTPAQAAAASFRLRHVQAKALRRAIEALLQRNEHGQVTPAQGAVDSLLGQVQAEIQQLQIEALRHLGGGRPHIRVFRTSPTSDQRYHEYANTPVVVPYSFEEVAEVPLHWKFRLEVDGLHPQRHAYSAPQFDDTDWSTISIGRAWEDQGYAGYDEGAWYRTTIAVAADSVRPVLMAFGGVDKDAFVYVNGRLAGQHHSWDLPFILDVSDHVVRDGENVVALYVYDGARMGGVYGLINVHQPTEEMETADFAANRGGRLHLVYREADWPDFRFINAGGYEKYANRPPRVPYPHQMVAEVPMEWKFRLDVGAMNPQRRRQYADLDYDDSQWTDISIGQAWEDQGYPYDEGAWYRTRFMVDAEEVRPVHLAFGGVDKDAYVYVNGQLVGQHLVRNRPFILDISSQVVRDGENTVAIYVYDGADMGGVYGLIQVLQPTGDENLDRYLANRGGSVKRSFWSRFF